MSEVIQNVSDTSIWVAHYRALETKLPEPLFKDPFAGILVGDRAPSMESIKSRVANFTSWVVVIRTCIIDQMIADLVSKGVTAFLNVGAGLDSRPYRMSLDPRLRWIEVDFPHVIDYKRKRLEQYKPNCELQSIGLDLSDRSSRQSLLAEIARNNPKVAVLTEGVLPYLAEEQVTELSRDLNRHPSFEYWICEYFSPKAYRYLKDPKRMKVLKNAPFRFYPENWTNYFQGLGWRLAQLQYYAEVSEVLGRPTPMPPLFKLFELILGKQWAAPLKRMSGFMIWERDDTGSKGIADKG